MNCPFRETANAVGWKVSNSFTFDESEIGGGVSFILNSIH